MGYLFGLIMDEEEYELDEEDNELDAVVLLLELIIP